MATAPLDLNNVQGDILIGLPKKFEAYWFIQIEATQVTEFRTQISQLVPLITSSVQTAADRDNCTQHKNEGKLLTLTGVNISFSKKGLLKIGITDPLSDAADADPFEQTMLATAAEKFNDRVDGPDATWLPEFREEIHALIFITGDCQATLDDTLAKVKAIFGSTVKEIKFVQGVVRPKEEKGHEHFGYLDGISQPAVKDVDTVLLPGQAAQLEPIDQGIILLGRPGDAKIGSRPDWTWDGSFLAFRYLSQLVPEFQEFINSKNPPDAPADFLGAQLVGRWKSGTPIVLGPKADVPGLGDDPQRNNDFNYDINSQDVCPYVAHTRKTNPRADLASVGGTATRRILRRGIQFGPEVTDSEKAAGKTDPANDRGLLFKCYQSNIENGFQFIQQSWANTTTFPFLSVGPGGLVPKPGFTTTDGPGFDAIIGQATGGGVRPIDIKGGNDQDGKIDLAIEWVVSKGGEYFFSPSISVLGSKFALAPVAEL